MRSSWRPAPIERARPLLGTRVEVRAAHADDARVHAAIDAAFAEIAQVHRLMSFQEAQSDVSSVNRRAAREPVRVDPRTAAVVALALDVARASDGAFDPAVGAAAVACGALSRPAGAPAPHLEGCWRDVILEGEMVRLSRPVWLDLGGIAKGYAVDQAIRRLSELGVRTACVNAGGDLRVLGEPAEVVRLRAGPAADLRAVEITDGALASSGGDGEAPHFDGAAGAPLPRRRFASVAAPMCAAADALTKVVLARGEAAAPVLAAHGAWAWTYDDAAGWRAIGGAP